MITTGVGDRVLHSNKKAKHSHTPSRDEAAEYTSRRSSTIDEQNDEQEDEDDEEEDNIMPFIAYHSRARWSSEINSLYDDEDLLGPYEVAFDLDTPRQSRKRGRNSAGNTNKSDRRVRFNDGLRIQSLESSSSSDDDETFIRQDRLSAQLKRMIEEDDDANDSDAFWRLAEDEDMDDYEDGSSSGYETDCGDTTDEDMPPVPNTRARTRRVSSSVSVSSSPEKPVTRTLFSKPIARSFSRPGPKMGSWAVDASKPIAVVDASGKTMVIYQAPRRGSPGSRGHSRLNSSVSSIAGTAPSTPHPGFGDDSESDNRDLTSVLGSMFGNFTNSSGALSTSQIVGPPEAFLPFVDSNGIVLEQEDEDEDDEDLWNITDFIDFGDGSSSDDSDTAREEESDRGGVSSSDAERVPPTPLSTAASVTTATQLSETSSPTSPIRDPESLLSHFDKGIVGAFRRNQIRHRSGIRGMTPSMSSSRLSRNASTNNYAHQSHNQHLLNTSNALQARLGLGMGLRNALELDVTGRGAFNAGVSRRDQKKKFGFSKENNDSLAGRTGSRRRVMQPPQRGNLRN